MRTSAEMFTLFEKITHSSDKIRVMTLEGSRVNSNVVPDIWQDYDITFLVTDVDGFKQSDEWLKVLYDNQIGYVYKDYVSATKMTTSNVHLRTKPSKDSQSMKVIKKHQEVEVVDQDGLWSQGFYDGKLGFIYSAYLSNDGAKSDPDPD